jgi:hypothetical protein
MEHYAKSDVSLDTVSVCIVNGTGKVLIEAKVVCAPEALVTWFQKLDFVPERIGMEAGPLSQWFHEGMRNEGFVRRWRHSAFRAPRPHCREKCASESCRSTSAPGVCAARCRNGPISRGQP